MPSIISLLTPQQVSLLSTAAIVDLETTDIAALSTAQVNALTATQVRNWVFSDDDGRARSYADPTACKECEGRQSRKDAAAANHYLRHFNRRPW